MRKPVDFLNFQISHRATVPGLNLPFSLVENPNGFWHPCFFSPSLFFAFLSLLSPALYLLPIFLSQIYLLLIVMYSITLTILLLFLFTSQITTILSLNSIKDIPSWDFVWHYIMYLMLHLHDILSSCQHITSLLISSAMFFLKNHRFQEDGRTLFWVGGQMTLASWTGKTCWSGPTSGLSLPLLINHFFPSPLMNHLTPIPLELATDSEPSAPRP